MSVPLTLESDAGLKLILVPGRDTLSFVSLGKEHEEGILKVSNLTFFGNLKVHVLQHTMVVTEYSGDANDPSNAVQIFMYADGYKRWARLIQPEKAKLMTWKPLSETRNPRLKFAMFAWNATEFLEIAALQGLESFFFLKGEIVPRKYVKGHEVGGGKFTITIDKQGRIKIHDVKRKGLQIAICEYGTWKKNESLTWNSPEIGGTWNMFL